jgi:hypothetical protein
MYIMYVCRNVCVLINYFICVYLLKITAYESSCASEVCQHGKI